MLFVEENIRRNALLDRKYDPYTGKDSMQDRQLFELSDLKEKLYLPKSMVNLDWIQQLGECGNFFDFVNRYGDLYADIVLSDDPIGVAGRKFTNERLRQDFELWAHSGIKILDKDTFRLTAFYLRVAQQFLLLELEKMRTSGVPIRIVLLKARQWGGSTLVELYMMWIQDRHRENWHMAVCAQDDNAAKNIRSMYTKAAKSYPKHLGSITLKRYEQTTKNLVCMETGGIIGVGSVNNPDQFRSFNYAMIHLSEVGIYKDTPQRSAVNLITSLKETVPDQPYTMVVEESTAKGLNYFYDSWLKAVKGETRYKAVFVAWWMIDRCREDLSVDPVTFFESLSDYEKFVWELGATLEGINWYRNHKKDKGYTDWQMFQENPSTAEEAFQSSGQKVFAPDYINALRRDNTDPLFIGEVFAEARMGKDALKKIEFREVPNGNLRIWKFPDTDLKMKKRYVVVVDIGGRTEKADNSVIRVIDRYGMTTTDGYIEAVLTWCGHTDQDLLAWKAAQIATLYGNALLVIESNSLKKEEKEGDHFLTILNQIKDHYSNLYIRNDQERVGDEFVPKYGFLTTAKTKGQAVNAFNGASRERFLKIHDNDDGVYLKENDKRVCDEASWFETKTDGSQGAVKGKRDDMLIATAIGCHVALNDMSLPEKIKEAPIQKSNVKRGISTF